MAESSTNGKGQDETDTDKDIVEKPAVSTHESAPGDGGSPDHDAEILTRGTLVGRYLVVERLGAGAMGVVYAAYDPKLDRKIALKLLRPKEGVGDQARRTARLEREAQAIAKLSHPNVVGIFDVGVHEGQVFMAMEYLAGGTLHDWVAAKKRPWREIVKMFIEVGHGLAAAHVEGLIHRDFKPENVLLDKNGAPKVVDFGLVRLSAAADLTESGAIERSASGESESQSVEPSPRAGGSASLTRTGALTGTPAYMAPEQFLGKPIDARTDQFAFCVALYEALYGERPFAGETVLSLADSVTEGRMRALAKGTDVPAWVRACVIQGLRVDPTERYSEIDQLLAVLANDPIARRRRRLLIVAASMSLVAGVVVTRHFVLAKRQEIDRQVARDLSLADASLAGAAIRRDDAKTLRDRALAAFDGYDRDKGEALWAQSLSLARTASAAYELAIQYLGAAATLSPERGFRNRTADAIVEYLGIQELSTEERKAGIRLLATYDDGNIRTNRLNANARLRIDTTPEHLNARAEIFDGSTYRTMGPQRGLSRAPLVLDLAPGSYRVVFEESDAHVGFEYPIVLSAGEFFDRSIWVPPKSTVPDGFVYVPEGRFLFGSGDEEMRTGFLETVPIHQVNTQPFLISRFETTVREWISFLESLPSDRRKERLPHGSADAYGGAVSLRPLPGGRWEYMIRPANKTYRSESGKSFVYDDRKQLAFQDWTNFPVSGISPEDARAFCDWLNTSGKVPLARVCTEYEWERAARGADARDFPHGNKLAPQDANFDLTYNRRDEAFGPDEVGSHPASDSPFGISDLVGNVWEITNSVLDRGQQVIRGGSFYQFRPTQQSPNRQPIASTTRDQTIGLRVCASLPSQ
ncbi:MAG TPA: bifunctional serine/threonine-protein kinase/formylglycine-generating enzyme family protein [Polyangia bacterium]|jgi:formylglycine-generating enzyme required for sulfatase activity/predicted Ser/Thr protein kinase